VALPAALGSLESVTALVVAHVVAGGEEPSLWWLAAFAGLVYGAGRVVLRRRASIRVVLPALLVAQLLGHAWLVALAPAAHGHEHAAAAFLGLTPSMLAAHVAAVAVTGAMWALRRRVVEVLVGWTDPGVVPAPVRRPCRPVGTGRIRGAHHLRALAPTRGPPVSRAAFA